MPDRTAAPAPAPTRGLVDELEQLVPELPTTTLAELAARLDELIAEPSPTLPEVERVLGRLLDSR